MAEGPGPSPVARIRLLGGVQALGADGSVLDVGPAKCQIALAALALNVGSPTPVPHLIDAIWGEDPPRTAERTLQSYLARLRGALGSGSIDRAPGAYRLTLPPESVDVFRFERRLDEGDIEGAVSEWAGEPFAGLEAPGLEFARVRLTERWLAAVEQDLESRVDSDPAACVAQLSSLTTTYPFREGLWALLMTALYRVGRQADALASYRVARDRLADALGVEPGSRLQDLHGRILRQDPGLSPTVVRPTGRQPALPTGTVTFAFVDVEDAPGHWSRDATAMATEMVDHHARVSELTDRHGGTVFTHVGDSYGIAFASAVQATAWAADVHGAQACQVAGRDLRFRIGIHTGDAEQHDGTYFGAAVHVASRLAAVGSGGQTLASESTAGLIEGTHVDLGRWALEGVVSEVRILQIGAGTYAPLAAEDRHRGNIPDQPQSLGGA